MIKGDTLIDQNQVEFEKPQPQKENKDEDLDQQDKKNNQHKKVL